MVKRAGNNYWAVESKSYMKHFQSRCNDGIEQQLHWFLSDCENAKDEPPDLKLWTCFQSSSFVGTELTLLMTQFYLNGDWPNYLLYRKLVQNLYEKIVEWVLAVKPWDNHGNAFHSLQLGMVNQVVLPLLLGGDSTKSLPTFQLLLNNPLGTSTGFRPDLTETFSLMVKHKLEQTSLPIIERFEPENIYDYLAWRYRYCLKPSNEVDYALSLIPEELIAYHMMRGSSVDSNLLNDKHFIQLESALSAIRTGEVAHLDSSLLKEAINKVSELELSAYGEMGVEKVSLNSILGITKLSDPQFKSGWRWLGKVKRLLG